MASFGTIPAHLQTRAVRKNLLTKGLVTLAKPNFLKSRFSNRSHGMLCILVKATWNDTSIPCDDTALPHAPAFIVEGIPNAPRAVRLAVISPQMRVLRQQRMLVMGFVDLGRFDDQFVHANFPRAPADFFNFVLIRPDYQKLPNQMRSAPAVGFSSFHHVSRSFQDFLELASHPIRRVGRLRHAVDADDEPAQSGIHDGFAALFAQEMRIGRGGGVQPMRVPHGHQLVHLRMQVGFALEIQIQVDQMPPHLLQCPFE